MPTITRRGARWQAKVRRQGQAAQSRTFATKALAERWARETEVAIEAGRTTLGELLQRYRREITPTKKSSRPEELKLAALIAHPLARLAVGAVRSSDVAALRDELRDRGLAPNTVRLYLAPLSHAYNVARREWGFEGLANPVDAVTKPSVAGTARTRRAEGGELAKILKAARELGPWAPAVIELAVETAMRRGELAAMRWEHVDRAARVVHLPQTKNGEARDVPLSPRALAILKGLQQGEKTGPVFGLHPDTISKAMIRARAAAGVEGLRLHDLRREATSRLFERGDLSIVEVSAVTGHKTLQMLKRYTAPRAAEIAGKLARKTTRTRREKTA